MITVAMVALVIGSTWMTLRRIGYQEHATNHEETCKTIASEVDALSKELESAKSAGPSRGARAGATIEVMEKEITLREALLVRQRRYLERYRRAANRPWFAVEE